jgi:serine/threonine-protein kinase
VARTDLTSSRWDSLATGDVPALRFWYRSSPRDLVPLSMFAIPALNDPPLTITGMASLVLDTRGRLIDFAAVPPQVDTTSTPAKSADWTALFEAAALSMPEFRRVDSQWTPRVYADERAAWEGTLPGQPQTPLRIEAAAYRGKPVSFQIIGPWTVPSRMTQQPRTVTERLLTIAAGSILLMMIAGTAALARHNLRVGRGDRRGAARLSWFVLAVSMVAWAVGARHVVDVSSEVRQLLVNLAFGLLTACLLWLLYIALEPYVRRYCPDIMISWTRLLGWQLRDPLVGRDVLFGVAAGVFVVLLGLSYGALPPLLGNPPAFPRVGNLQYLLGARFAAAALLRTIPNALTNALFVALVFVMGRAISGRTWVGATAAVALSAVLVLGESGESPLIGVVFAALYTGVFVAALVYFGLLALVVAFFVNLAISNGVVTIDMSKMYAATGVWMMVVMAGLAVFGFYTSRAGQPLFGNLLPND